MMNFPEIENATYDMDYAIINLITRIDKRFLKGEICYLKI